MNFGEFHSFRSLEGRFPKIGFRFFGYFPIKPQKESNFGKNLNPPRRVSDSDLGKKSVYTYIYAVELKTGPRFGVSSVKNWSKSSVKNWSKFFFAVFSPVL